MAVMTQTQAKRFLEMEDRMIDILNFLRDKGIMDAQTHRKILLGGYFRLVEYLQLKKILTAKQADESLTGGFDVLIKNLAA